jgi:hypothetical protein
MKVKLFGGSLTRRLESDINGWLQAHEEEHGCPPMIYWVHQDICGNDTGMILISVWYEDKQLVSTSPFSLDLSSAMASQPGDMGSEQN